MALRPGELLDVRFTKWGGGRHWEFPVSYLGRDEHGLWAGGCTGTRLERPGAAFHSQVDWVVVFPEDRPWSASFYDGPDHPVSIFVDMTTPAAWDGTTVSLVDLDLDVVLLRDGGLFIDDEDEFAEHRVALGYPDEVVALARETADEVLRAVAGGQEPFASVGARWLRRLRTG